MSTTSIGASSLAQSATQVPQYKLQYVDSEEDTVTVRHELEWRAMVYEWHHQAADPTFTHGRRIFVVLDDNDLSSAAPSAGPDAETERSKSINTDPAPTTDQI